MHSIPEFLAQLALVRDDETQSEALRILVRDAQAAVEPVFDALAHLKPDEPWRIRDKPQAGTEA